MTLLEYLQLLRRNWLVITVAALLGVAAASTYLLLVTPQYSASTRLYIAAHAGDGAAASELSQSNSFAVQAAETYAGVAASPIVLQRAIDRLHLDESAQQLAERTTATAKDGTALLDISVTDADPTQAATVANAIGKAFEEVLTTQLETGRLGDAPLVSSTTIAPAIPPSAPSAPQPVTVIIAGLLAGLAVGIGVAVLRMVLDTRLRTVAAIEEATEVPYLGSILRDPEASVRPLLLQHDPRSPAAEAVRRVRAALEFVRFPAGHATFVVTSAGAAEGKSYSAGNLALALAETGARVALIDADLRRPQVGDRFGIEDGAGLSDLLIGRLELPDVLQPWGRQHLAVLPAGPVPPNPTELLGSPAMAAVIEDLQRQHDYVVIDAPPTLLVADAAVLSRVASVLLAVPHGRVSRAAVASVMRSLRSVGANVIGVVGTMVTATDDDTVSYGTYRYGAGPTTAPVDTAGVARADARRTQELAA
jgi:succinoglycan biosynthesis transport protein ExoP